MSLCTVDVFDDMADHDLVKRQIPEGDRWDHGEQVAWLGLVEVYPAAQIASPCADVQPETGGLVSFMVPSTPLPIFMKEPDRKPTQSAK